MSGELDSHVSGKIARTNPLGNGPEYEALFNGGVIATTKSTYASRLMEHHVIDPDEALALLGYDSSDLEDPEIYFEDPSAFYDFKHRTIDQFREEASKDLNVEVRRLRDIVDIVMSGYTVDDPDEARRRSYEIQDDIEDADKSYVTPKFDDLDALHPEDFRQQQSIRVMERDALHSGVRVELTEFVATMLSCNVLDEEFGSELGAVWIRAIDLTVDDFWRDNVRPEFSIDQMVAGRELFERMKRYLGDTYYHANDVAKQRWEEIEPAFVTNTISDHPLLTGTDRSEATTTWLETQKPPMQESIDESLIDPLTKAGLEGDVEQVFSTRNGKRVELVNLDGRKFVRRVYESEGSNDIEMAADTRFDLAYDAYIGMFNDASIDVVPNLLANTADSEDPAIIVEYVDDYVDVREIDIDAKVELLKGLGRLPTVSDRYLPDPQGFSVDAFVQDKNSGKTILLDIDPYLKYRGNGSRSRMDEIKADAVIGVYILRIIENIKYWARDDQERTAMAKAFVSTIQTVIDGNEGQTTFDSFGKLHLMGAGLDPDLL